MEPLQLPFSLEQFIAHPGIHTEQLLLAMAPGEPGAMQPVLFTWHIAGGQWVSGSVLDSMPCYIIGGPGITGPRVYGSLSAALAGLAATMRIPGARSAMPLPGAVLAMPDQRDVGAGCHYLQVTWRGLTRFVVVGPNGPRGPVQGSQVDADTATYELADGLIRLGII